jgi:hypothetical protein
MNTKLCENCIHYELTLLNRLLSGKRHGAMCKRRSFKICEVTGKQLQIKLPCTIERGDSNMCGPEGKYFIHKDAFLGMRINRFTTK